MIATAMSVIAIGAQVCCGGCRHASSQKAIGRNLVATVISTGCPRPSSMLLIGFTGRAASTAYRIER